MLDGPLFSDRRVVHAWGPICYKGFMGAQKYRQRGYQDEDRGKRDSQPSADPRPRREGPRGRGLGRPTETLFKCARCGQKLSMETAVGPGATCNGCGADLHSCTNCRHFDSAALFECRQEIPERIARKSTRNQCELFEPKMVQGFATERGTSDARSEFDSLFDF